MKSMSLGEWGVPSTLASTFHSASDNSLLQEIPTMVSLTYFNLKHLLSESPKGRIFCDMDYERFLWVELEQEFRQFSFVHRSLPVPLEKGLPQAQGVCEQKFSTEDISGILLGMEVQTWKLSSQVCSEVHGHLTLFLP